MDPNQQQTTQPEPTEPVHEVVHDHPDATTTSRTVVLAVDSSDHSKYAVEWSLTNFVNPATDLVVLLHTRPIATVPSPIGVSYVDFSDYLREIEHNNRAHSHQLLRTYAELVKSKKISCKAIALRGDPRDELVRKTKEVNADVLVIGSRGLGAVKRTFLGSVSDYCIHHVHCPVVVVKPVDKK